MPPANTLASLTEAQRELLLDVGQLTLDVAGIFDPTPVADVTSAVISLIRGNWGAAAISSIAAVPYVGDLAKLNSIQRYMNVVDRAIQAARIDHRFASVLRPVLTTLDDALTRVPVAQLSVAMRNNVTALQRSIRAFLPESVNMRRLQRLVDDMLLRVFGSTANIGSHQRANLEIVVKYFEDTGVAGNDPAKWAGYIKGIDLHAAKDIEVITFKAGDRIGQYVDIGMNTTKEIAHEAFGMGGGRVGDWMILKPGAGDVGISMQGRFFKWFTFTSEVKVLKSKAAPILDKFTSMVRTGAQRGTTEMRAITREVKLTPTVEFKAVGTKEFKLQPTREIKLPTGRPVGGKLDPKGEFAAGGGDQYFLPNARNYLRAD